MSGGVDDWSDYTADHPRAEESEATKGKSAQDSGRGYVWRKAEQRKTCIRR